MSDEDGQFSELGYTVFAGCPKKLEEIIQLGLEQNQVQTPAVQDETPVPVQAETPAAPDFPYAFTDQSSVYEGLGGTPLGQESDPVPGMGVEVYRSEQGEPEGADEPDETPDESQEITGQNFQ
jgi:hypothetical protein